jgi:hypothetical protein
LQSSFLAQNENIFDSAGIYTQISHSPGYTATYTALMQFMIKPAIRLNYWQHFTLSQANLKNTHNFMILQLIL